MKLHEIKARDGNGEKTIHMEPADGIYGKIKLDVKFKFTAGGSSRHGDNSSFDEDHDDEYDVISVKLAQDVDEMDDDGHEVVKTWKAGANAEKLPGWSKDDDETVLDKIYKK